MPNDDHPKTQESPSAEKLSDRLKLQAFEPSATAIENQADRTAVDKKLSAEMRQKRLLALQAFRESYANLWNVHEGECADFAMNIEKGWKSAGESESSFIIFQVEQLLDQAADLLDRGLRDRAEWDRRAVDAVNLGIELEQFFRLDEIHKKEEDAGYYTWAASVARSDATAEKTLYESADLSAGNITRYGDNYLEGKLLLQRKIAARYGALLSALPAFIEDGDHKNLKPYSWRPASGVEVKGYKPDLLMEFAEWDTDPRFYLETLLLQNQRNALLSSAQAGKQRFAGATDKQKWEENNILFQQERTEVVRDEMYLKRLLATCSDGVLNHKQRMDGIQLRFHRDFRDAISRLKAAAQGLKQIYGYSVPFPDDNLPNYFDHVLDWTRGAIRERVRFSHYDQNLAFPLSVRSLCGGDEKWREGRTKGQWKCRLTENMMPIGLRHVRLRGISAFIVDDAKSPSGLWQVTVRAPRRSMCRMLNDHVEFLDQNEIPPCWLYRTTDRQDRREPDVVGAVALHNVSPFSIDTSIATPVRDPADLRTDDDWEISVGLSSSTGAPRDTLKDIFVDLFLAVQVKRGTAGS